MKQQKALLGTIILAQHLENSPEDAVSGEPRRLSAGLTRRKNKPFSTPSKNFAPVVRSVIPERCCETRALCSS